MPDPHSLTTRLDSVSADAVRLDAVRAVGQRMSEHERTGLDYRWPLIATITLKPIALLRELVARPDVRVTRGTTYDNEDNPASISSFPRKRESTGRQPPFAIVDSRFRGSEELSGIACCASLGALVLIAYHHYQPPRHLLSMI